MTLYSIDQFPSYIFWGATTTFYESETKILCPRYVFVVTFHHDISKHNFFMHKLICFLYHWSLMFIMVVGGDVFCNTVLNSIIEHITGPLFKSFIVSH